jgi:WD40 repeat protein
MRRYVLLFVLFLAVTAISAYAQTDLPDTDGIPANCETASPYANPNLFPRYANGQLALIDWSSGDTVRVLETASAASNFWLLGWSPDCHYLAGGLGDGLRYTTVIWDATSGAQIGTVADGYRRPHFLTWSPRGDSLVVETRHGAFLWDLATGNRLQLTLDATNGRSFRQIHWNYETDSLDTQHLAGTPISYALSSGRPLNSVRDLDEDEYIVSGLHQVYSLVRTVTAPNERTPYSCAHIYHRDADHIETVPYATYIPNTFFRMYGDSLLIEETGTGDNLQIIDGEFLEGVRQGWAYGELSDHCDMFFTAFLMNRVNYRRLGVVLRFRDNATIHTIPNMPWLWSRDFPHLMLRQQWDSTGRYLFAQSYDGAQVWDSATDNTFYVTSAEESQRYGYSVNTVTWDGANGRISVDMLYSAEVRVFDLATGQRVG